MGDEQEDFINDYVVADGLRFLRSLTEKYGAEKGMAFWHELGHVLGDEIQGEIFFAMIAGTDHDKVTFRSGPTVNQAVSVIKCIRVYTGLGLKEAKDLWDASRMRMVKIDCKRASQSEFVRELRALGCEAH